MEKNIIQKKVFEMLDEAKIAYTQVEKENLEITDLGLNDIDNIGIQIIVYENNDRYCAKELILLPNQTCPEHRHPRLNDENPGKKETFRVRNGEVYLFSENISETLVGDFIPKGYEDVFTVKTGIILKEGEQFTIPENTLHWFKAGNDGAIVSEFSSTSDDESDIFTDKRIKRVE